MGIDYLSVIRADADAIVAAARRGPLDAPVAACPGWDVARLVGHVARVHRWATAVADARQPPDGGGEKPPTGDTVIDYFEAGVGPLLDALGQLDPAESCWNFTSSAQLGAFWPRRQAMETAVHRFDAEVAVGDPRQIEATVASDGIDELLAVLAPSRLTGRDGIDIGGSVHVHVTDPDVAGEWTLRTDDGLYTLSTGHSRGDVAAKGPASALLLMLWRRIDPTADGLEIFGDAEVLSRWLALGVP